MGAVPLRPEPVSVDSGLPENFVTPTKIGWPPSLSGESIDATPPTSSSAKPLVIGLSLVAVGLAALAGYGLMQGNELKESLDKADSTVVVVEKGSKALNSDLEKTIKNLADTREEHEGAISKKDEEISEAKAKANEAADELAKQEQKTKELLGKIEAANSIVEEKERLANELVNLKKEKEDMDRKNASNIAEAERRAQELSNRKPETKFSIPTKDTHAPRKTSEIKENKPQSSEKKPKELKLAWNSLCKYENGKNKGRWYFEAPDGFVSPLYDSREKAIYEAELRAGFRQPTNRTSK